MVLQRLIGSDKEAKRNRPKECSESELIREKFTLETSHGSLQGEVFRAPGPAQPAVLVNCSCYSSMVSPLEKDGLYYATHGYAYVLAFQPGPPTEVADKVFERWHEDAAVLLDWLGEQAWCDGRVGCHGMSLLGNTAFAALQVSLAKDAPPTRPKICAVFPAITFSRIHPTIFFSGEGMAAELIARFLWLAEVGTREGSLRGLAYARAMFGFFLCHDLPGLHDALGEDLTRADMALWKRSNYLWQNGMRQQRMTDKFWHNRDVMCDLRALGAALPPIHLVTGWWDVFKDQALEDYAEAVAARGEQGGVRLTIYAGGHFQVAQKAPEVTPQTLDWYDKHIRGMDVALPERPVRVEVVEASGKGGEFLELDSWPPPRDNVMELFLHGDRAGQSRLGSLSTSLPSSSSSLKYIYDPRNPTPYSGGGWLNLRKDGPKHQGSIETRSDVAVLTSQPLEIATEVLGIVGVTLYVASSAPECDFVARLCVVRGRTRRLIACGGRMRGESLESKSSYNLCEGYKRVRFDDGADEDAGERRKRVDIDLGAICCRFNPGDRIRLQVCSAAHPKALRHPLSPTNDALSNELGPPATQEVIIDAGCPSRIRLPVRGAKRERRFSDPMVSPFLLA